MRIANVSTNLEGTSRLWDDRFFAGGGEMDASTRVASDELLARGELSVLGVWMDLVGGMGCVRGIAGMDVDSGWTSLSGSSDG